MNIFLTFYLQYLSMPKFNTTGIMKGVIPLQQCEHTV